MQATRHYTLDAYNCYVEQADSIMLVNDLLTQLTGVLNLNPVMPPFILPYYYCEDPDDGGISAFCLCANGSHITIHTFPYRSCFFVDILTDQYFVEAEVNSLISKLIYAGTMKSKVVDRRDFTQTYADIDTEYDFGPHYMITLDNIETSFEEIYKWLDKIAPKINMTPITRPYVIYDKIENPNYISGILVVAQSHIAFHYSLKEKKANLDIFSCSFLDNDVVENIIKDSFGTTAMCNLVVRGSKHVIKSQQHSRASRNELYKKWRNNI